MVEAIKKQETVIMEQADLIEEVGFLPSAEGWARFCQMHTARLSLN